MPDGEGKPDINTLPDLSNKGTGQKPDIHALPDLKKKGSSSTGQGTISTQQENGQPKPSGISRTSLKEVTPNITTDAWTIGGHASTPATTPFQEASEDAELEKKITDLQTAYFDANAMGQLPLANPNQMLTGKQMQKMDEKSINTNLKYNFLSNPTYLASDNRDKFYNSLPANLPKEAKERIRNQGEYYANQQAAYNVARNEAGKNPSAKNLAAIGNYQALNGDNKTALTTFKMITEKYPNNAEGYKGLALLSYNAHNIPQAINFIDEGLKKTPNDSKLLTDKANYQWLVGKHTEAVNAINEAIKNAEPGTKELANAYQMRAAIRNAMGNIPGAADDREKGLQAYDTYNKRVNYYAKGGQGIPKESTQTEFNLQEPKNGKEKNTETQATVEENPPVEPNIGDKIKAAQAKGDYNEVNRLISETTYGKNMNDEYAKERQDWINKTQGTGIYGMISNPGFYFADHFNGAIKQISEGIPKMLDGLNSLNMGILSQGNTDNLTPTGIADNLKNIVRGGLETVSGVAGFTPGGVGLNLGFEFAQKNLPVTYSYLQPGAYFSKDKQTQEDINNVVGLAVLVGAHHLLGTAVATVEERSIPEVKTIDIDYEDVTDQKAPLLISSPLDKSPLQTFTREDILSGQNRATIMQSVLSGKELSTDDVQKIQGDFKNITDIKQFQDQLSTDASNVPSPVWGQLDASLKTFIDQKKKFEEAQNPTEPIKSTEPIMTTIGKQDAKIEFNEQGVVNKITIADKPYTVENKNGALSFKDEKGDEIVNNKKVSDLTKAALIQPELKEPEPATVNSNVVDVPTENVPFTVNPVPFGDAEKARKTGKAIINKIDYTAGEMAEPYEGMPESEMNKLIADKSKNPAQIIHAYEEEREKVDVQLDDAKKNAIKDALLAGVTEDSYRNFGDRNRVEGGMAMQFFRKTGNTIDQVANIASDALTKGENVDFISPDDIVQYMEGAKYEAKRNPLMKSLEARFKEVTGQPLSQKQIDLKDKQLSEIAKQHGKELTNEEFWAQSPEEIANSLTTQEEFTEGPSTATGEEIERNPKIKPADYTKGNETERIVASGESIKGHYVWLDPSQVEPQHVAGNPNLKNFLWDKSPSNRPMLKYGQEFGNQTLGASETIHEGAPAINNRGEIWQGNGRDNAIKNIEDKDVYNADMASQAKETGIDAKTINANPVGALYWMADIDDAKAGELSGKTELDIFDKDWVDVVNDNFSNLHPDDLRLFGRILTRDGYDIPQGLIKHGAAFLDALEDAGMIKGYEANIFRSGQGLNSMGLEKIQAMVQNVITTGLTGESKEPFMEDMKALPAHLPEALTSQGFRMLSMGINSPLPLIQRAVMTIAEYRKEGRNMSFEDYMDKHDVILDDHESAIISMLNSTAHPADFKMFLDQYETNLKGNPLNGIDPQSQTEALNNALSAFKTENGVDKALKPISNEEDREKTDTERKTSAQQGVGEGTPTQQAGGAPPAPPKSPNVSDYTEPPIDPSDRKDIDVVANAGFGYNYFKKYLNAINPYHFNRLYLTEARHTIENSMRARSGNKVQRDGQLYKLQQRLFKDYPMTRDETLELWHTLNKQHVADGIARKEAELKKQPAPEIKRAPVPESFTDNQKEHYKAISDLKDKMAATASNMEKLGFQTPEFSAMVNETLNYLPEKELSHSERVKYFEMLKDVAEKSLRKKNIDWNKLSVEQQRNLADDIGSYFEGGKLKLYKNGLTSDDFESMQTMKKIYKAEAPDKSSFVIRFNDKKGIIEKWVDKKPEPVATYKGKTKKSGELSAPKKAVWVAKEPEAGKADHYILDARKRNLVRKAERTKYDFQREQLLADAGLPKDFLTKFEAKKSPNQTIATIVHKTGVFTGADGKEYKVLPATTEEKETHTNAVYDKNGTWAAIQAYRAMDDMYHNALYFHDIMNSPSMKPLVFTPDKFQTEVIKMNSEDYIKRNNGIRSLSKAQKEEADKIRTKAYEIAKIPASLEDMTTPRMADKGNSVMPDQYLDTYFKKGDYEMLKGDMVRAPQSSTKAVSGLMNLWYINMNPIGHVYNELVNFVGEGTNPTLLDKAAKAFHTQDKFYQEYLKAGGFSVGNETKGYKDMLTGMVDELGKEDSEYMQTMKDLEPVGGKKVIQKIIGGAQALSRGLHKFDNALLWHSQNIALFNHALSRMEKFGFKLPDKLDDIDWSKPEPNIALQKSIADMQRTVQTYYLGDKAYGMNNKLGQALANLSRNKNLTIFQAYRHGVIRVLKNRVGDLSKGMLSEAGELLGGTKVSDETRRRALEAHLWVDRTVAIAGSIALLNQLTNQDDTNKTDNWIFPGYVGMVHKGYEALKTFMTPSTGTDKTTAVSKAIGGTVALSPVLVDGYSLFTNRDSYTGKPIVNSAAPVMDNAIKVMDYFGKGGNIFTAIEHMTNGQQGDLKRGIMEMTLPVNFGTYTPAEQQAVENMWGWHNYYAEKTRDMENKLHDLAKNVDAQEGPTDEEKKQYVDLAKQYIDICDSAQGDLDRWMVTSIQRQIDEIKEGTQSPLTYQVNRKLQGSDITALEFWQKLLDNAKTSEQNRKEHFDALRQTNDYKSAEAERKSNEKDITSLYELAK